MTNTTDTQALLARVAENVRLREGPAGVEAFLRCVSQHEPAPLNEIARHIRLPIPVATAVRRELESEGLLGREGGVSMTQAGRDFIGDGLGLSGKKAAICDTCGGTGLAHPDRQLIAQFEQLLEHAPGTRVELDQAPCTAETSLRRAALMHRAGALEGRRILILGDDDSISLAIHHYLSGQGAAAPAHIAVLEIDPDRIAFLEWQAGETGADIEIRSHDLRDPLPGDWIGQFDTFQTDPPYTIEGARLFLERAREGLKPGGSASGFLSFGQPSPKEQFALMGVIHSLAFAVTDLHRDFNAYQGASILGSTGQMIELVGPFEKGTPASQRYTGSLYTADKTDRRRVYKCRNCRWQGELGKNGVPSKIEKLKSAGCPSCGETVFQRQAGGSERRHRQS